MTYGQKLQQEGRLQGFENGIIRGIEKGMEKERFHIAKAMLEKGLGLTLIQDVTGLSEEELEKL